MTEMVTSGLMRGRWKRGHGRNEAPALWRKPPENRNSPSLRLPRQRPTLLVIVFSREDDARRVLDVLSKRFEKYGLSLHPEKTRMVEFKRPDRRDHLDGKPGTFDLLGFTHFWRKSRKGHWVIFQHTAKDRFRRALKRISEWCQRYLHAPIRWQRDALERKLVGHFRYYGHFGDRSHPARFRFRVIGIWRKWLDRRSQKARMSWERMKTLLERYTLPDVHDVMARRIA